MLYHLDFYTSDDLAEILARSAKLLDLQYEDGTLGELFLIENREFYDGGKTYMSRAWPT